MSIFKLPQDIIFYILSLVPTKSLIHFLCICTSAPPLISHPSFINLHLSAATDTDRTLIYYKSIDFNNYFYSLRSPLTFHESLQLQVPFENVHRSYRQIAGSHKGLICLFYTTFESCVGTLILWNPSIQKFKFVDGPHNAHDAWSHVHDAWAHYVMGFGFVNRTCEFKIVEIAYHSKTSNTVWVYSLSNGTDSWEKKEGVSAPCNLPRRWTRNVFVNGLVNWLVLKEEDDSSQHVVMAFDLDRERFRLVELPKIVVPNCYQVSIATYGIGDASSLSLSLCVGYLDHWDVWVMGDYGLVDSWKKLFVISLPNLSCPPLLIKNEHQVLIVLKGGRLMLLDAIKNEVQDLKTQGSSNFFHAVTYTASLALLHG